MRFGLDSVIYLLATLAGATSLAACSNSLHRRNVNIGEQSAAAAARNILLIIKTTDLSNAGYALSVGAGGIAVGSLILFLHSLHLVPVTSFVRKIFFLSPLMLVLNSLLTLASALAVTIIAKTKSASADAYLGTVKIPDATLQATLKASGVSLAYWANGYVHFMVGAAWPAVILGPVAAFLAYRAWRELKNTPEHAPSREAATEPSRIDSRFDEKAEIQHIA